MFLDASLTNPAADGKELPVTPQGYSLFPIMFHALLKLALRKKVHLSEHKSTFVHASSPPVDILTGKSLTEVENRVH
jgi:hypothetical protein